MILIRFVRARGGITAEAMVARRGIPIFVVGRKTMMTSGVTASAKERRRGDGHVLAGPSQVGEKGRREGERVCGLGPWWPMQVGEEEAKAVRFAGQEERREEMEPRFHFLFM